MEKHFRVYVYSPKLNHFAFVLPNTNADQAESIKKRIIDEKELYNIKMATMLHDIGFIKNVK